LKTEYGPGDERERPVGVSVDPFLQVRHRGSKSVTRWLFLLTKLSETRALSML
jgi:hypothetical protein